MRSYKRKSPPDLARLSPLALLLLLYCSLSPDASAFKLKTEAAGIESRKANLESRWSLSRYTTKGVSFVLDNFWDELNHEELTHRSFGCASDAESRICMLPTSASARAPLAALVGVRWNDNPPFVLEDGQTLSGCRGTTIKLPALQPDCWLKVFLDGQRRASVRADGSPGEQFNSANRSALLLRSHFGDMQFLHAMATRDGELASDTKAQIMSWAEFSYRVAQSEIAPGAYLYELKIPGFAALFDKQRGWTAMTLFTLGDGTFRVEPDFSWLAFGSLLHVVQDSFARGHADRADTPGQVCRLSNGSEFPKPGRIRSFRSYANQDSGTHANEDSVRAMTEHLLSPPPGAVEVGAALLAFHRNKTPWQIVSEYLDVCVFDLEDASAAAGPGQEFRVRR